MACVIGLPFILSSCYLARQGYTQLSLLNRRQPITEVIDRSDVDLQTKKKLAFTRDVLEFARKEELVVGDSYQTFVKLDGPAVSYLVQASYPHELKLKTWWFPIVGTVPYLGFFDVKERDNYASELEREGYEVFRGAASAFSSLGWFSDPVYSSMLKDDEVELAHLYFHELTHKTAWIKGSVEFNENFAEYIGEALTEKFFKELGRLEELESAKVRRRDRELFKVWLKDLKGSLEKIFEEHSSESRDQLIQLKNNAIEIALSQRPKFQVADYIGQGKWNTPRILASSLYSPDTKKFQDAHRCLGLKTMGQFAGQLKEILKRSSKAELDALPICD